MPIRDAEATRARILDAAVAEFAAVGYSGGRIDRIARGAQANVRMIYVYFTDKELLFEAALIAAVRSMAAAVPPTPDDLPAWSGRLFDHHQRDPTALRINMWAQLERPSSSSEPMEDYLAKVVAMSDLAAAPLGAVDLLVVVYAIAQAWYLTPVGLLEADGTDSASATRLAAHRAAVVASVTRIVGAASD